MFGNAEFVRSTFSLTQDGAEWVARGGGEPIRGERAEVVRLARARWGHFTREVEAFNAIFTVRP